MLTILPEPTIRGNVLDYAIKVIVPSNYELIRVWWYISSWKSTKRRHIEHTRKGVIVVRIENRLTLEKLLQDAQTKIFTIDTVLQTSKPHVTAGIQA